MPDRAITAAATPCSTIATTGTRVRCADRGDAAEEQAVLGHREIDARRGQHALAEEAERRDGDAERDQGRAALAQREPHDVARRRLGCGQAGGPERMDADEGDAAV